MNKLRLLLITLTLLALVAPPLAAHCEVPCGIYTDNLRFHQIHEEISTIEKAMIQVVELSAAESPNHNQIVRWINTKEEHATKIQHIATQYFLTQRIKESQEKYGDHLKQLHRIMVAAMKCKQSTDLAAVQQLKEAVASFHQAYMGPMEKAHEAKH